MHGLWEILITLMAGFVDEAVAIFETIFRMKKQLFVSFLPFIFVLAAFVAFVRWNGSVVLGNFHPSSLFQNVKHMKWSFYYYRY